MGGRNTADAFKLSGKLLQTGKPQFLGDLPHSQPPFPQQHLALFNADAIDVLTGRNAQMEAEQLVKIGDAHMYCRCQIFQREFFVNILRNDPYGVVYNLVLRMDGVRRSKRIR